MGHLSDFLRGQIVGVRLAGASVTKTATLLCLSRAAISTVVMASAKRNSDRKPKLSARDRCTLNGIVSKITELLQQR